MAVTAEPAQEGSGGSGPETDSVGAPWVATDVFRSALKLAGARPRSLWAISLLFALVMGTVVFAILLVALPEGGVVFDRTRGLPAGGASTRFANLALALGALTFFFGLAGLRRSTTRLRTVQARRSQPGSV